MNPTIPASPSVAPRRARLWPALYILSYFLLVGIAFGLLERSVANLVFFGLIGVATGGGLLVQLRARKGQTRAGRRSSLAIVGLALFLGAGVFGRQSFQIEGFFFYALAGVFGGVVTHYLVAKVVGPLLIGRAWCGWGCWVWMVLDYLPWHRSPGRRGGLGWLRVAHFATSLGLVAALVFVFRYDHGFEWKRTDGLWWFLGGCAFYYGAGIALAAAFKDNRAFCKYLCPVTVLLRAGARASVLKIAGDASQCTECGACTKACPMDIDVEAYVRRGTRVLDPECTACQTCVGVCASKSLGLSLGFDLGRDRPSEPPRARPPLALG